MKNPHWADYWQQHARAMMLVIRASDGKIRWTDVSAYLIHEDTSETRRSGKSSLEAIGLTS
jgi:hypothetical protein